MEFQNEFHLRERADDHFRQGQMGQRRPPNYLYLRPLLLKKTFGVAALIPRPNLALQNWERISLRIVVD